MLRVGRAWGGAMVLVLAACGPGSDARIDTFLQGDIFDRLVIEVDVVEGAHPEPGVSDAIAVQVAEVVDKPGGVRIRLDEVLPPYGPSYVWSLDALRNLLAATESVPPVGTALMHTLIVDGQPPEPGTLGMSFAHRDVVLFKDSLCGADRELVDCRPAEHFVWLHEIGHVLGLVNNGTTMVVDHEDPEHPQHCDEPNCVMRWAYTRFRGSAETLEERAEPPSFGVWCRMDLAAGREPL